MEMETFADVTPESGTDVPGLEVAAAAFLDYDQDGCWISS